MFCSPSPHCSPSRPLLHVSHMTERWSHTGYFGNEASVTTYYASAAIVFVVPPTGSKGRAVFVAKASKGRAGTSGANASSAPAEEAKGTRYSGKAAAKKDGLPFMKRPLKPFLFSIPAWTLTPERWYCSPGTLAPIQRFVFACLQQKHRPCNPQPPRTSRTP